MLDPMIDWHVNVLARTIYGMARGLEDDPREAIAALVMNRCLAATKFDTQNRWGLTIADVCLWPDAFECWTPGSHHRQAAIRAVPGDKAFLECFLLAFRACHGFYSDLTMGADTYLEVGAPTDFEEPAEFTATVGPWDFYRHLPEPANVA